MSPLQEPRVIDERRVKRQPLHGKNMLHMGPDLHSKYHDLLYFESECLRQFIELDPCLESAEITSRLVRVYTHVD